MINWPKLQREFLEGDYMTFKEFAEAKGLSPAAVSKNLRGMLDIKQRKASLYHDAMDLTIQKISDKLMEEQKEAMHSICQNLQSIIAKSIEFALTPKGYSDRRMLLEIIGMISGGAKSPFGNNINIFQQENKYEINYDKLTDDEVIQLEKLVSKATTGNLKEIEPGEDKEGL